MLTFLRRQAFLRGLLGGGRGWTGLWGVLFAAHLARRFTKPKPKTVFAQQLQAGEALVIRHERPER